MSSFYNLPALGERVTLLTHFVVREDAQVLFGFLTHEERATFRQLVKISGVGPRTALSILSGLSVTELAQAVTLQDSGRLVKVPGIGKKTAERLLLELKGKLGDATSARRPSVASERAGRHPAGAARARLQRPRGGGGAEGAAGRRRGQRRHQAGAEGAREVSAPVAASVLHACARHPARRHRTVDLRPSTSPAFSNLSFSGKLSPSFSGAFRPINIRCMPPGLSSTVLPAGTSIASSWRMRITSPSIVIVCSSTRRRRPACTRRDQADRLGPCSSSVR